VHRRYDIDHFDRGERDAEPVEPAMQEIGADRLGLDTDLPAAGPGFGDLPAFRDLPPSEWSKS
jgi:hypothetical protein